MLMTVLVLEDLKIVATGREDGKWNLDIMDSQRKVSWQGEATTVQMSAIAALAIGIGEEDDLTSYACVEQLYAIARLALEKCPKECYPIP